MKLASVILPLVLAVLVIVVWSQSGYGSWWALSALYLLGMLDGRKLYASILLYREKGTEGRE